MSETDKYSGKSKVWRRARATALAKSVLTKLYTDEYEKIYKQILEEEFGLVCKQKPRTKSGLHDKYLPKIKKMKGE